MREILETRNLTKRFGQQTAVDHLSLKIQENSIYGLLGPNGAGKSTVLKMIAGIDVYKRQAWICSALDHRNAGERASEKP